MSALTASSAVPNEERRHTGDSPTERIDGERTEGHTELIGKTRQIGSEASLVVHADQRQLEFPNFTTNVDTATGRQTERNATAFACLWAKLFPKSPCTSFANPTPFLCHN